MNPLRWSYRVSSLVGFLICMALLGFALFAQYRLGMDPCPMCEFQRFAFVAMGVFFVLGALHGPRGSGRWVYTVLVLLAAAFGIAVASRQLYIQSLPPDQVPACGPSLSYMLDAFPFAKVFKMVFLGSGDCAKPSPILGLPMPLWALIWYVLLSVLSITAAVRRVVSR